MTKVPPEFNSGPGDPTDYPTTDLTIFLRGESRKVTIDLIGKTFRPHKPITIVPFNGDGSLYNTSTSNPPHLSATFHANVRAKGSNPLKKGDEYTLHFGDGLSLDPAIQNPGGNPGSSW